MAGGTRARSNGVRRMTRATAFAAITEGWDIPGEPRHRRRVGCPAEIEASKQASNERFLWGTKADIILHHLTASSV